MPSRTIEQILKTNAIHTQEVQEQMERVSRQLQPMLARLDTGLIDMARRIYPTIQRIADAARRIVQTAMRPLQHFLRSINQNPQKLLRWISEWWERIKEELPKGLKAMAARGWFMDDEMPLEFVTSFESRMMDDPQAAEDELIAYYKDRMYTIEEGISRDYPHRRRFFQEAFRAHRDGWYTLSTQAFFAQADGIWNDRCSRSLFSRGGPNAAAADYQTQSALGIFSDILLSPLSIRAPLWLNPKERDQSFNGLNRHQIMHGESVNYNTETNSLKAMSFLTYISTLLRPSAAL